MKVADLLEGYYKDIDIDRQESNYYCLEIGFDGTRYYGETNAKSREDAINKLRYRLQRQLRADYPQHYYRLVIRNRDLTNIRDLRRPEDRSPGSVMIRR